VCRCPEAHCRSSAQAVGEVEEGAGEMRHWKTRTVYGSVRRAFCTEQHRLLNERLARLAVLYEDLRLELHGVMYKEEYPNLDGSGFHLRQSYFLRRMFGTLREFAEAMRLLNDCPDFLQILRPKLNAYYTELWDSAVEYFKTTEHRITQI